MMSGSTDTTSEIRHEPPQPCPLCGGTSFEIFISNDYDVDFIDGGGRGGTLIWARCRTCNHPLLRDTGARDNAWQQKTDADLAAAINLFKPKR
jgi:hypothetical protein